MGKIFLKYLRKSFKVLHIDDKQFKIEGREFALWKLIKQLVYFTIFYACFQSLNFNNEDINLGNILIFDFIRIGQFHVSVYHIFLIVVVLFIAKLILNFLKIYLHKRVSKKTHFDKGTEFVIIQLVKYVVYTVAIIVIVRSFGIGLDLLLGGSAALLVGIGLGLQDIFKDFLSGLLLLFEGTIKVGDIIELPSENLGEANVATIEEINLRTTKVKTREGKTLILPNSVLTHQSVNNWSYDDKLTRFSISLSVAYKSDMDLVKQILINFGDNGLEMDLVFWADQNFYIEIYKSEIRFAINEEFNKHNVVIPFPQSDVYIKNINDKNS